jgi:hypothetical protein
MKKLLLPFVFALAGALPALANPQTVQVNLTVLHSSDPAEVDGYKKLFEETVSRRDDVTLHTGSGYPDLFFNVLVIKDKGAVVYTLVIKGPNAAYYDALALGYASDDVIKIVNPHPEELLTYTYIAWSPDQLKDGVTTGVNTAVPMAVAKINAAQARADARTATSSSRADAARSRIDTRSRTETPRQPRPPSSHN